MKKATLIAVIYFVFETIVLAQTPWSNGKLQVSPNNRYLQHENGKPFFWQGDIAWLLLQRLNREEMKMYFENRKAKGFNVVQCIFFQYYTDTNPYGDSAYINKNITTPYRTKGNDPKDATQYDFWDHADYAVEIAAQNGIYLAIAPTWGQLVKRDNDMTTEKATKFAADIALHFKDKPNIIWLNGGSTPGDMKQEIWEAIGTSIKKNDPNHLMTFHPFGRTQSSTWFQNASWLDFNMFTSGHRNYKQDDTQRKIGEDNWRYVQEDLSRTPLKPTVDGESSFENMPQGLHDHTQPYWSAADIRRYAYWSVFAGAMGHTYGQNTVRQVHKKGENKAESGAKLSFVEALEDTGSFHIQYLTRLILSRPYFDRVNDQSIVEGNEGERYDRVLVTRGKDYLMAYTYTGRDFKLKMGSISGKTLKGWWYNPKTGAVIDGGKFKNKGSINFNPPNDKMAGNDWVLVLDDVSKKFAIPGKPIQN